MNDKIQEIRSKLDIVDVISSYIPLSKHGKNFFGICPFHDDNNPSMSVSREKQIYRCFSCGASGNVFTFVQNYEQITFSETMKILSSKAGVSLDNFKFKERSTKYDRFYQAYDLANKIYQNNINSNLGSIAKEYLKSRNIDDELISEFGIGLSLSNENQISKGLEKKDFNLNELNTIGLSNGSRDMYQGRIMFPLWDTVGRIVAFSGRRYKSDEGGKYINSKETPIFIKGHMLYNYHRARENVRVKKQVIVMEGFMDVIRAHTADVKNTVALMGTAMTSEQLSLIKRLSNNVVLCFDGDDAGIHATIVNGEALEKENINLKVVELSDGDDPDTYILKHGKDAFNDLINNAITFQDFKIKRLKIGKNLSSDEEKANYINDVLKETIKINDEIRIEIILKNLAIEFNLSYNTLEKRFNDLKKQITTPKVENKPFNFNNNAVVKKNKYYYAPRAVLCYMMTNVEVLTLYNTKGIFFPNEKYRRFASMISSYYKEYGKITIADFYTYLYEKNELLDLMSEIMALELPDYSDNIINDYIKVMEEEYRNHEIDRLMKMIKETSDINEKIRLSKKVESIKLGS